MLKLDDVLEILAIPLLTGTTSSSALAASWLPSDIRRLHRNKRLGETAWSRVTAETLMPGCMVCSTNWTFSSAL